VKLIVGLGNPGPQYEKTRHNVGAMVVDVLVASAGERWKVHKKSGAQVATARLAGEPVLIARPTTYMNTSGQQVGPLAKFYSVAPEDLIVVHDELDIDFGLVRLKRGGGEADTTACGRSARCSALAITCGSAWASAGLRGGRIRLTSCSNRFPPRQRPTSDFSSETARKRPRSWSGRA